MWFVTMLACTGADPDDPVDDVATDDAPSPTGTDDTGSPPLPTGSTGDTAPDDTGSPPCDPDPALQISDLSVVQPLNPNEAQVSITLSTEATVAVACTAASDPSEVHLIEGTSASTGHTLRLSGLLGDTTYDCVAAPVCPTQTGPATPFTVVTDPLPGRLPVMTAQTFDAAAGSEYVLFNHSDDCWWDEQQLVVMDRDGQIRWWFDTPTWVGPSVEFRYHGDDRFAWGGGWLPNAQGRPRQVDLFDGEVYDAAAAMPDVGQSDFHHDGKQLADGRLLTLEEVTIENGLIDFLGFRVRRIDPATDTVDFDYHSQRGFDEGHLPAGFLDAWHANWADIAEVDGQEVLFVSLCFTQQVVAIDVATGQWRWTFGAGGDFSLVDDSGAPLPDNEFPLCQHGLEVEGDRMLVYDNGDGRGYSRASEYQIDEATMTATLLWTWTEPDWYETTLGDVDWMPDDRVLIGMGHAECFSSNRGDYTTIAEIDPASGTKLWEARQTDQDAMAYRADWADPCALFHNAKYCDPLADRLVELAPILEP